MATKNERTKVFVPDDSLVWVNGEIVRELDGSNFEIVITDAEYVKNGSLSETKIVTLNKVLDALPLQNDIPVSGVDDMTTLNYLHEASILDNLKRRFYHKHPYTYTGDICIAVNPYQWLDIYSPELRDKYISVPKHEMMPHVYATSASAYRGLRDRNRNQSILVSGESGAGKTETVKILMGHLAQVSGKENDTTIIKVLKANPLLESFGNAKTVRNDNSSRFGKFTQLQFDQNSKLVGSKCVTYLLEKTRVICQNDEHERNYHIFHELFAAPESVKASLYISSLSCRDFMYTCQGDTRTDTIEGVTDGARFLTTMTTLGLIGVTGALQQQIREIIIGIVFLGQICFSGDADTSSISSAVSEETIERCCSLLGLDVIAFKKRVIVRNIEAAGDTLSVALSREQATDGRDALAKDAYTRLFMWLVSIINESTAASETDTQRNRIIGLLDIFGFESFRVNRFEQLCINYTNEKLQAKFTSDVLMSVQAEYREEGLDWETIDYKDNNDVLELLESRLGFIALLNEECLLPKGSNGNFLNKISSAFQKNYLFSLSVLKSKDEFGIRHYAGMVSYNVNGFLERNKDALPSEMRALMLTSTKALVSHIFSPMDAGLIDCLESLTPPGFALSEEKDKEESSSTDDASPAVSRSPLPPRRKTSPRASVTYTGGSGPANRPQSFMKADTVLTKFKSQLTSLMESISLTDVNYVRCIKPNSNKDRAEYNRVMVVEQLRCAGIIEAVKVSRAAYPYRVSHNEFMSRFRCLRPSKWWQHHGHHNHSLSGAKVGDRKEHCRLLLDAHSHHIAALPIKNGSKIAATRKLFDLGASKVFFSDGVLEVLERERSSTLSCQATLVARKVKARRQRRRYLLVRACLVALQAFYRCRAKRREYIRKLSAICRIQNSVRQVQAIRFLVQLRRTYYATRIQAFSRMWRWHRRFLSLRRGLVLLSSIVRRVAQRARYLKLRDQAREDSKLTNQLEILRQQLAREKEQRCLAEAAVQTQQLEASNAAQQLQQRQLDQQMLDEVSRHNEKERLLAVENDLLRKQIEEMMASAAAAKHSVVAIEVPRLIENVHLESNGGLIEDPTTLSDICVRSPTKDVPNQFGVTETPSTPQVSHVTMVAAAVVSPPPLQPISPYPEDYERIKEELAMMRRLVEQVTLSNTAQNIAAVSLSSPGSLADSGLTTRGEHVPSTPQKDSPSTPHRSASVAFFKSPQQRRTSANSAIATRHHSISSSHKIGMLQHSHHKVAVDVREMKIESKLKNTEGELDKSLKKIARLEEANRLLKTKSAANLISPSSADRNLMNRTTASPMRSQSMLSMLGTTKEEYAHDLASDSDDSCADEEDEEMVVELDNRNSDWQAYLGSFHDLRDLHAMGDLDEDPHDAQFDEDGDEILPVQSESSLSMDEPLKIETDKVMDDVDEDFYEVFDDDDDDLSRSTLDTTPVLVSRRFADEKDSDDESDAEDSAVGLSRSTSERVGDLDSDVDDVAQRQTIVSEHTDEHNNSMDVYDSMQSRSVAQARVSSNSFDMYDVYAQCDDEDTSAQGPAYLQEGVIEETLPAPELTPSRNGSLREEFSIEVAGEVLLAAVERLDVEEVTRLLAEHPKIAKAQDRMGQTALHLACRAGVVTLVEALLDFNVYVDATDFGGKTPLHVSRNAAVVRLLCNEGASVNKPDEAGLVPLHEYVLCESLECVGVVLSFGASPVVAESTNLRSAIHMAADLGNYEMLSLLVQESTAVINYDQPDVDGFTALQLAASCDRETGGQLKIFMLLLNRGASAVLSNERGISPLHLICANRSLSRQLLAEPIVELLLGLQADPNAQDVDGCTPLIVACAYREWGLCKLLLEAGGDLNIPCTMNSIFLQGDTRISFSKDKNDIKTVALMENSDCTASDLMTKGARHNLFGSISVAQTRIPGETRDRCMNCAATFGGDTSSFGSMFRISSGKHHCRLCLRVVCQDCSQQELPRSQMPDFVQNSNTESSMRVCLVCCSVLKHRVASTEPKKAGFWG